MADFCAGSFRFPLGERTYIMGILNVTPDSFSDGGRYFDRDAALSHAQEMEREGADILDIGAQSTRPGHTPVTAEEEWARLEPVLRNLRGRTALPLSVDTYYPSVAAAAVEAGAAIINDVSGSLENGMPRVAAETGAGLVMMHAGGGADGAGRGTPWKRSAGISARRWRRLLPPACRRSGSAWIRGSASARTGRGISPSRPGWGN